MVFNNTLVSSNALAISDIVISSNATAIVKQ